MIYPGMIKKIPIIDKEDTIYNLYALWNDIICEELLVLSAYLDHG